MTRQNSEMITPERLMEVIDGVYRAWESHASNGIAPRHPLDILGAPDMPECMREFTLYEVEEASKFLERMGVVPARCKRWCSSG